MTSTRRVPLFAICSGSTTSFTPSFVPSKAILRQGGGSSGVKWPPSSGVIRCAGGGGARRPRGTQPPARGAGISPTRLLRHVGSSAPLRVGCLDPGHGELRIEACGGGGSGDAGRRGRRRRQRSPRPGAGRAERTSWTPWPSTSGSVPQKLEDATKAAAVDQVNADLAAGRITKAQADELKKRIEAGNGVLGGPGRFGGGPGFPGGPGGPDGPGFARPGRHRQRGRRGGQVPRPRRERAAHQARERAVAGRRRQGAEQGPRRPEVRDPRRRQGRPRQGRGRPRSSRRARPTTSSTS